MILGITHKTNQISQDIVGLLETRGELMSWKEIIINESQYYNILYKCGLSERQYIINHPKAIANSLDASSNQQIFATNNIHYGNTSGEILNRHYEVLVFEMSCISVKQVTYGKVIDQSKYLDEEQCKKIADLAKRAIYLLGLDYGMVSIAVTGISKTFISYVDSSPIIRERDLKSLLGKLDRIIANIDKMACKEIKLGADPEFMLSNARSGRMIPASQFFPREGLVGCDNIRMPSRQHRPVAEVRPKPDCSPLQLFSNIREALHHASKLVPQRNVKWLAGSRPFSGYSIGGHIHLSNTELNNHILRALDSYVGLPIFLIENQSTAVKRRDKYGFIADFRIKDHGGFEYRTPGSWLVSPEIATAVLCLVKIVASNYLSLPRNCFLTLESQRAFYEGNQDYLRPMFDQIWSDLQELDMYDSFKAELQPIYYMITNNINWNENEDIRKTWSIASSSSSSSSNHLRTPHPTPNQSNTPSSNRTRRNNASASNRTSHSGPTYVSTQLFSNRFYF